MIAIQDGSHDTVRNNVHVLIADDDREIRSALRLALLEVSAQLRDEAAAQVSEASDADEVRAHLEGPPLDAVLLDWELPEHGGGDMLAEIRAHAPSCTVIAMSGRPEARGDSLDSGADYFVGKNDPPSRLLDLLRDLWTRTRPGRSVR